MKVRQRTVLIKFWDHAQCSGDTIEPVCCQVVGFLVNENKLTYSVVSWIADQIIDHDSEAFAILKSAVISLTYLKPSRRQRGKAFNSHKENRPNHQKN